VQNGMGAQPILCGQASSKRARPTGLVAACVRASACPKPHADGRPTLQLGLSPAVSNTRTVSSAKRRAMFVHALFRLRDAYGVMACDDPLRADAEIAERRGCRRRMDGPAKCHVRCCSLGSLALFDVSFEALR
jgi:hypothetical protein